MLIAGSKDTNISLWDLISDVGLMKLKGHKNEITDIKIIEKESKYIVSSSKDTLLKVWDIETQHCVQTVVGHPSEVWSFDINPEQTRLITLSDHFLRVYTLERPGEQNESDDRAMNIEDHIKDDSEGILFFWGTIERKRKERGICIQYNPDGSSISIQSTGKFMEIVKVYTKEEVKERRKGRLRKEKARMKKRMQEEGSKDEDIVINTDSIPSDEFFISQEIMFSAKLQSFSYVGKDQMIVTLQNNTLELYRISIRKKGDSEGMPSEKISTLDLPGHRSDVRSLCLSSNDEVLLTSGGNLLKAWNIQTGNCIRTIHSGFGLSVVFAPGDRHAVLGTKEGKLEIYDLQSSRLLEIVDAHTAPIWGIQLRHDNSGIISVSADKRLKFWNFNFKQVEDDSSNLRTRFLSLELDKSFDLPDDVLSVKCSRDGKLIAVALLDSTVRVYFSETMKLYHTLYGHKLPVMSLDISDDSTLLITGSSDKDIKIWGLDFGDCHKSIFAHADAVMHVSFVPGTHYFFSSGKDGMIKYWDADRFEHVLGLEGHHSEVWTLAVSSDGSFLVSGSQDRSIRVWERTEEQVIVDTEREIELRQHWETSLETEDRYELDDQRESDRATKKTIESVLSTERLIEALEVCNVEFENLEIYKKEVEEMNARGEDGSSLPLPTPNILLMGKEPREYLLNVIKNIRSTELEESILILPFNLSLMLIEHLNIWIKSNIEMELCTRCLLFLMNIHQVQISANRNVMLELNSIRDNVRNKLKYQKDLMGFNQAALEMMKLHLESEKTDFKEIAEKHLKEKNKKRKRKNYWE